MRPLALVIAGLAAAALAAPAHGATRVWKITGALSGGYSIQYSIDRGSGCPDAVSESVTDVRVALRLSRLVYDTSVRSIRSVRRLSLSFGAGEATFLGTTTPRTDQGCGAPVSYSCTGQVRGETGTRAVGRLNLFKTRRDFRGFIEDSTLVIVRGGPGGPPETPCEEMSQPTGTRGDFGPEANEVLSGLIRVPHSKLAGRRAFTVVARPAGNEQAACDRDIVTGCTERSTLRLSLTFRPA